MKWLQASLFLLLAGGAWAQQPSSSRGRRRSMTSCSGAVT